MHEKRPSPDLNLQGNPSKTSFRLSLLTAGLILATLFIGPGCTTSQMQSPKKSESVRFAVISDPHLHVAQLGNSGEKFDEYLAKDPKLLKESEAILEAALESVTSERVQFMLIAGDLTKDGELANHQAMVQHLKRLEQSGIQVFVVPGNHDINNPEAVSYACSSSHPVPNITPRQFATLYKQFGYDEAIDRDPASLSYLAEPTPGIWLLAIDSCKYDQSIQAGSNVISGCIRPDTIAWIEAKLQEARSKGKIVIAFMHHGLNQHFIGQNEQFGQYLVDDWQNTSLRLAKAGLKVIFTGHYHSQDAAYLVDETLTPMSPLCDIQTASLVQYPCAFRIATLDTNNMLQIETRYVTSIHADTSDVPFQQYAERFLRTRLLPLVTRELVARFNLPQDAANKAAPLITEALIANYAGDETPPPSVRTIIDEWTNGSEPHRTLGFLLRGIWTDLPPADVKCAIPLNAN